VIRLRLWLSLVLVLLSSNAFGNVLYLVEWESKPGAPWSYSAGSPLVDCSVPPSPSGGCALKFVYQAGTYSTSFSGGNAAINLPTPLNELWIGHWNRYSSGFVFNNSGTKMDLISLADKGQYNFRANMAVGWQHNTNTPPSVATNQIVWGPGSQNFTANYYATTNTWVWVEEHFVINTPGQANGIYEFYVDDVLKGRFTNVPYRDSSVTRGWDRFFHTATWGGGGGTVPVTQYWWVDHSVISTTRIGRPGSASGTNVPPNPPVGVVVR
jgi:hypothetical protein